MGKISCLLAIGLIFLILCVRANVPVYTNTADTGVYYYHAGHSLKSGVVRTVVKIIGFKKHG